MGSDEIVFAEWIIALRIVNSDGAPQEDTSSRAADRTNAIVFMSMILGRWTAVRITNGHRAARVASEPNVRTTNGLED